MRSIKNGTVTLDTKGKPHPPSSDPTAHVKLLVLGKTLKIYERKLALTLYLWSPFITVRAPCMMMMMMMKWITTNITTIC